MVYLATFTVKKSPTVCKYAIIECLGYVENSQIESSSFHTPSVTGCTHLKTTQSKTL